MYKVLICRELQPSLLETLVAELHLEDAKPVDSLIPGLYRRVIMKATYDIFRELPDSSPIWIESVQGLENAKVRLSNLIKSRPGGYFVYDPEAAKIVATAMAFA